MCWVILGTWAVPSQYPRSPPRDLLSPDRGRPPRKDREDARRVFVDQAARETLSATLTPSTAAGGADGERWTEEPAASAAATRASSTRCRSTRRAGRNLCTQFIGQCRRAAQASESIAR